MGVKERAFPLLRLPSLSDTILVRLAPSSSWIPEALSARSNGKHQFTVSENGQVEGALKVGNLYIPLTFVGEQYGTDNILIHSPGLEGAFAVPRHTLNHFRGTVLPGVHPTNPTLSTLCVAESLRCASDTSTTLDHLYRVTRRRHFSLLGTEKLLAIGSTIHPEGLDLSFPYHCGSGGQALKQYLDITPEVGALFSEGTTTKDSLHGDKILSRFGISTCVGVSQRDAFLGVPAMMWHPSGAPSACLAPLLHGCRRLKVGQTALAYNGPTQHCSLLSLEDPRLYMKDGAVDDTEWLCKGLFDCLPGEPWEESCYVLGVGYDAQHNEMDLFGRTSSGDVKLLDDLTRTA